MKNLADILINSTEAYPDNIALVCEDETITYHELNILAEKFCGHYRSHSIKTNEVVVVVAYKSIPVIAALQGAIRADLIYVVVDPRTPISRIKNILEDCEARYLIVDDNYKENWPILAESINGTLKNVIVLDELATPQSDGKHNCTCTDLTAINQIPVTESNSYQFERQGGDTAYILYTSGSTGVPKGVKISHSNALGFIFWADEEFKFTSDENLLSHSHLGFDISVLDIYNGLRAGARVTLIPEYNAVFPAYVVDIIKKHQITSVYLVPSFIVSMLIKGNLAKVNPSHLKRVLYAGEPFPMEYLHKLANWCKNIDLYNLYGPIETNVCTFHKIGSIPPDAKQVPVGLPIKDTSIAVLQDDGILNATGQGEICVAGPCVTEGYTNRPDLNGSQFLNRGNRRWYRTGDYGEIDSQGIVWCSGRIDHLIKTRGYRVDLQEIESKLYQIPFISEAAVVGIPNEITTNSIVAWCVGKKIEATADIKNILSETLPSYMIPQSVFWVTELPKSMRGKIDRMKLIRMVEEYEC